MGLSTTDLNEIVVFTRVVQAGSFIAASGQLGIPKSTVSRKVADLERRLNARLLQRTTRKLSLTDVGRTYFDQCARIVGEIEDAERMVTSLQNTPRGPLRITTGPNVAFLGPIISDYLKRYPDVRIEIVATTRAVDLVEERFDLAIRAGQLADSTIVARLLGRVAWFLAATPGYLKKRGRPRTPADLRKHDYLSFGMGLDNVGPRLESDGRVVDVSLTARFATAEMQLLHAVAMTGLGIALLPAYLCVEDLRARRLERILPEWSAPSVPVHVVYPTTRHLSPKVKTFLDHLHARMTPPPWELGPAP
jgi:DNA-binding transcriptional LysR family regulator